jgi:hypothetical protein
MAISNYTELKASVGNWMTRTDLAGEAAEFISLAEAALNRELDPVETDVALTGTISSRRIDIASTSCVEPIALFLAEAGCDEIELTPRTDGTFPYTVTADRPSVWAIDGANIDFDCPLDKAYPFRFRLRQRFALSDAQPTNWLLTNHPDVYLAAVLVWGGVFIQDDPTASRWVSILSNGIPSVRNIIAQGKRALLSVDPVLAPSRNRSNGARVWLY